MKLFSYALIVILISIFVFLFFIFKNKPTNEEKQKIIEQAKQLYDQKKVVGMKFSSQCLGDVGDYAVDIVHVPRTAEDNLPENQCEDYRTGKVHHFIELDKDGNVVRIV